LSPKVEKPMNFARQRTGMITRNSSLRYLFRDLFSDAVTAGDYNATSATPGPGLRTSTDSEDKLSGNGSLVSAGGKTSPAWGDPGLYAPWFSRVIGRAFRAAFTPAAANKRGSIGWDSDRASGLSYGSAVFDNDSKVYHNFPSVDTRYAYSAGVRYEIASVLRPIGSQLWIKAPNDSQHTLLWVDHSQADDLVNPAATSYDGAWTSDDWDVRDLPAPWDSDGGICASVLTNPAADTIATITPDCLLDITFTFNGSFAGFWIRGIEVANRWIVYAQADGRLQLVESNGGASNTRLSVNGVFAATNSYRLVVVCDGNTYALWVDGVYKGGYTDPGSFLIAGAQMKISAVSGGVSKVYGPGATRCRMSTHALSSVLCPMATARPLERATTPRLTDTRIYWRTA